MPSHRHHYRRRMTACMQRRLQATAAASPLTAFARSAALPVTLTAD